MLILQKCWDENIQTKLFSYTRKPIWQVNSAFQQAVGYENRDKDTHKTRIHTLVSASHSYKDECSKTGDSEEEAGQVFSGSGKPGKSCNFIVAFFRTEKSWKQTTGAGKV